jgi:hypothetical protein
MNKDFISFKRVLDFTAQTNFSSELIEEISKWKQIVKSPYGLSFYNDVVGWGFKVDGSLRISDHWNFTSHGKVHCETTTDVPNTTHWALAKYDASINKYIILQVYPKTQTILKNTFIFKWYLLNSSYEMTIQKAQLFQHEHINMNYLKRYYSLLESHFVNPNSLQYATC